MAINVNIKVDGLLDTVTPLPDVLRLPAAEFYPGSRQVQDGQRDVNIAGNVGVIDPSKLFGYEGTTWIAFMDVSYLGPGVPDLVIGVTRERKVPNLPVFMNKFEDPIYRNTDYAKYNVAIIPDGYVMRFAGTSLGLPTPGPWNIALTVSRVRNAEDYSKICAI